MIQTPHTLPPPPTTDGDESDEEDDWDRILESDIVLTTYDALDKATCFNVLHKVSWGRVVLDEMQEIRVRLFLSLCFGMSRVIV